MAQDTHYDLSVTLEHLDLMKHQDLTDSCTADDSKAIYSTVITVRVQFDSSVEVCDQTLVFCWLAFMVVCK